MQRELGITFVYVTHSQSEAFAMADRVVIISNGKIAEIGNPRDIYRAPANRFVAEFVGRNNILSGTAGRTSKGRMTVDCALGKFAVAVNGDAAPQLGETSGFAVSADLVQTGRKKIKTDNAVACSLISEEFVGSVVTLFLEADDGTEFRSNCRNASWPPWICRRVTLFTSAGTQPMLTFWARHNDDDQKPNSLAERCPVRLLHLLRHGCGQPHQDSYNRLYPITMGRYGHTVAIPPILDTYCAVQHQAVLLHPAGALNTILRPWNRCWRTATNGHHGWIHEDPVTTLGEQRKWIEKALDAHQKICDSKLRGYRAPVYDVTQEVADLLIVHEFVYDSSLMADDIPYLMQTSAGDLLELPFH